MIGKSNKHFLVFVLVFLVFSSESIAQVFVDLEAGLITGTKYNEVRIPGDDGSLFNFSDDFDSNPELFYRIRVGYQIKNRHVISILFAPLSINYSDAIFSQPINFMNKAFSAGNEISGRYTFNSYRLTYRYNMISNESLVLGAGLTGKIRDAAIQLSNTELSSEKTDLGFVPLINIYANWNFYGPFSLLLEGDALVGPQGRAEDIFLGLIHAPTDNLKIKLGYRVLEGGADNDEVYNFSWINYSSVGLIINF